MLNEGEAKVLFGDGEAQVVSRGRYVRCAVTGRHIPIEELRYWNVERQEAYIDAEAALKARG